MSRNVCYLICFRDPQTGDPARYQHAGHYLGTTEADRLDVHVEEHRQGRAAVLTAVARAAGLDFKITRTWPGGHRKERQLKTRSGALYCPDCSPHPQPGTAPPQPGAEYLTRRQREARAAAQAVSGPEPERLSLYELERLGTTVDGTPLPVITTYPSPAAAPDKAASREEDEMFGRGARAAARAEDARRAEADALFAEADRWEAQGAAPDAGASAAAGPGGTGTGLDAEVDRLAALYPEPETPGPGSGADPVPVGAAIRDWMADLPDDGREFLREALRDAIEYRRADGACADCAAAEADGLCPDHMEDELAADRYADRLAQMDRDDELAAAAARLYEAPLPPAGLPRLLDPAGAAPRALEATGLPDGTPHPDPVLAAGGWETTLGGMYHRVPQAQMELEAG
jgi:hypothetical protein